MASPSRVRQRKTPGAPPRAGDYEQDDEDHIDVVFQNQVCYSITPLSWHVAQVLPLTKKSRSTFEQALDTPQASAAVVGVLTALAFMLRFYKINQPDQVV
jgi:dolichyl-phosphate-mannose-protein mannosyltransferase